MKLVDEWWHVIGNPGHALAEATYFLFEMTIGAVVHFFWQKRHDRLHH